MEVFENIFTYFQAPRPHTFTSICSSEEDRSILNKLLWLSNRSIPSSVNIKTGQGFFVPVFVFLRVKSQFFSFVLSPVNFICRNITALCSHLLPSGDWTPCSNHKVIERINHWLTASVISCSLLSQTSICVSHWTECKTVLSSGNYICLILGFPS